MFSTYTEEDETLTIKRRKGNGSVLIFLEEYDSIMETAHILASKKNAERLYPSIEQLGVKLLWHDH